MRIVLISTPTRQYIANYIIPTGILSIAAYLRDEGHEVFFLDAALHRKTHADTAQEVTGLKPDVIGIGGIITSYAYIIGLTQELKQALPLIPVIVGGHVVINNIKNCFEHMKVDYLVHGYGEIAISKLASHLAGKLDINLIPGISYRDGSYAVSNPGREYVKDINSLPLPAYDLADMEHYATVFGKDRKLEEWLKKRNKSITNYRFMTMMGALGCIARCTFCVHEQEFLGIRYFSDAYIVKHLRHLYDNYNIRIVAIGEEMFVADAPRVRNFNRLVKEHFPDLYWRAATRAQFVTQEFVSALEEDDSNCYSFTFGYESGSQRILNLMNKRTLVEENINAYNLLKNSKNLNVACSLMVGNVGETQKSIDETIDSIKRAGMRGSAVFFTSPYPGGRIWDWAVERGIISNTHEYLMNASGKDAIGNININLTPYPNWVLWAWRALVESELANQAFKREVGSRARMAHLFKRFFPLLRAWPLSPAARGISGKVKELFRDKRLITWAAPKATIRLGLAVFFAYYAISRKLFMTAKDKMHRYETDAKGVLLPGKLVRGDVQRYHDEMSLNKILGKPRDLIKLADEK